ncbi:MAG: sigma-70 family RNA polymerase sigma factor [Defluviitaleaceae bacterium]|nr:sigma-70 family RNA polymerase sigma factor [Defluviitaleaceae bacterium]
MRETLQIDDVKLLAAAQHELGAGNQHADSPAFEEIIRRYERLIYHVAYRYFNNSEDALDAAQDATIKIYNGLSRVVLPENGSLKAWICTVTARTCLDALRKRRPQTTELTETTPTAPLPSAEESAEANERVQEVLAAIKKLPDDHRMVLILRDMQGLSYEELADALKITVGTVKSRLSRARAGVRKALNS